MEKEKKGIRCSYGFLVIILFATVCFLTDYIVIDRKLQEDKITIFDDEEVIKDNNNGVSSSIKIDSSKDYIYDASYNFDFTKDSYYANGRLINKGDIVVPYININSDAARAANDELSKIYIDLCNKFNSAAESDYFYKVSKYDYYLVDNILSVVVTVTAGGTDVPIEYYYTYNFNLTDGSLMSYSDIYSAAGITSDMIDIEVVNTASIVMQDKFKFSDDPSASDYFYTYYNETYDDYISSVNNGTIKYFIDSNKNLNVVVSLSIPAGRGHFDTILKVN